MRYERAIQIIRRIFFLLRQAIDGVSRWLLSVLATLGIPSLPILIDLLKSDEVDRGTYLLTAVILSATFLFSAEHNLFRFSYIALLIVTLLLDTLTLNANIALMADRYAGTLLLAVAILHASERFWWHVVLDRPFPDWLGASDDE